MAYYTQSVISLCILSNFNYRNQLFQARLLILFYFAIVIFPLNKIGKDLQTFVPSFLHFLYAPLIVCNLLEILPFLLHPTLLFIFPLYHFIPLSISLSLLHFIACFHHFDGANEARLE